MEEEEQCQVLGNNTFNDAAHHHLLDSAQQAANGRRSVIKKINRSAACSQDYDALREITPK